MRFSFLSIVLLNISFPFYVKAIDEIGFKAENCGCHSISIFCEDSSGISKRCGPNARACATNNSPQYGDIGCQMYLNRQDCELFGLDPWNVNGPLPPKLFDQDNCGDLVKNVSSNPERDLLAAKACCTVKHELGHSTDTVCHDRIFDPLCLETQTYDTSYSCLADISKEFCKLHGDKAQYSQMCTKVCEEAIAFRALGLKAICDCNNSTNGASQNCEKLCKSEIVLEDLPAECFSKETLDKMKKNPAIWGDVANFICTKPLVSTAISSKENEHIAPVGVNSTQQLDSSEARQSMGKY